MSLAPPLPEPLLFDYATGASSPAIGLLMAAHLSMSRESRALLATMEAVGGALLEDLDDEPLERISAADVLAIADRDEDDVSKMAELVLERSGPRASVPPTFVQDALPEPLRAAESELGGDRRWRWLGFGVAATKLAVSSEHERAHLLWAKGGTDIITHRHVGREVVLVLKGAFWDDGVRYGPGDVAVSEDGTIHNPHIDGDDDCVCLAVTEAPVHFTGLVGLALNRFCRF
ncbi:MAG: ChrR family anti-sigma-E factor [Pseudomonadota bacterium]